MKVNLVRGVEDPFTYPQTTSLKHVNTQSKPGKLSELSNRAANRVVCWCHTSLVGCLHQRFQDVVHWMQISAQMHENHCGLFLLHGFCCVDPCSPFFSPWIAVIMFINYLWNGFQAEADWLYSGCQQAFWAGAEPLGQTSRAPPAFAFRLDPSAQERAAQTDKLWQAKASHTAWFLTI